MAEIDKAIKRAEIAERKNIAHEANIEKQKQRIDSLDRKANPHRYRLSSGQHSQVFACHLAIQTYQAFAFKQ